MSIAVTERPVTSPSLELASPLAFCASARTDTPFRRDDDELLSANVDGLTIYDERHDSTIDRSWVVYKDSYT